MAVALLVAYPGLAGCPSRSLSAPLLAAGVTPSEHGPGGLTVPVDGAWHEAAYRPDGVFAAVIEAMTGNEPLDPSGIARLVKGSDAAGNARMLVKSTAYDCRANPARVPPRYLGPLCGGATTIREHIYARGDADANGGGTGDGRAAWLASLRRMAGDGRLAIADLRDDPDFMAARTAGHLAFPLAAFLVTGPDRSRVAIVSTRTAGSAGAVDDARIETIAIYSRM